MTPEEARSQFDAAFDGELSADEQRAFAEALARDPVLQADYRAQQEVREATAKLARAATEVDLLAGVQQKLRVRSGGRFYRDRFAEHAHRGGRSGGLKWLVVLSACLITAVVLWFLYDAGLLARSP